MLDGVQAAAVSFEAGFELQPDQQCAYNLVVCAHACGDVRTMHKAFMRLAQVQREQVTPSAGHCLQQHRMLTSPWGKQVQKPDLLVGDEAGERPHPALSPAERWMTPPVASCARSTLREEGRRSALFAMW
jgi:hypothetical protein